MAEEKKTQAAKSTGSAKKAADTEKIPAAKKTAGTEKAAAAKKSTKTTTAKAPSKTVRRVKQAAQQVEQVTNNSKGGTKNVTGSIRYGGNKRFGSIY